MYIFIYTHVVNTHPPSTANLQPKILDFRGFDSSRILTLRGGIPRPIGNFPESLSRAILVGIILALTNLSGTSSERCEKDPDQETVKTCLEKTLLEKTCLEKLVSACLAPSEYTEHCSIPFPRAWDKVWNGL